MSTDYHAQQIAEIRAQVAELTRRMVSHRDVTVTATDPVASTFTATLPDGQVLSPISAPAQFLPSVGQTVTLRLAGATPIYDPAGVAVDAIGDREVSSMSASLLSASTFTANLIAAGTVLTASTGQRAGLTPIGIQAWDGSNNPTVVIDGNNNLIQGTTQTGPDGTRRIVMGAAGAAGKIQLIGADGTLSEVTSYTESGTEAMRVGNPVDGAWEPWNSIQHQSNERSYWSSGRLDVTYGGNTAPGSKAFVVSEGADSGSPGTQPTRTERLKVDTSQVIASSPDGNTQHQITNGTLRAFVGATSTEGSIDVIPHGIADANLRSPRHQYRCEGGTIAMNVKAVAASGGSSLRLEVTNTSDAYGEIRASAFTVSSTEAEKTQIKDFAGSALEKVRAMRPRTYRRISRAAVIRDDDGNDVQVPESRGPVELGLVAEEAPAEIVHGQSEAINLYALVTVLVGAVKELSDQVDQLKARKA